MAFIIWASVSFLMILIAIYMWFAKKPVNFWANDPSELKVSDITAYNHALAKLFAAYGVMLCLSGLPLLGTSKGLFVITMLGTVFSTMLLLIIYTLKIEPKYRK